MGINLIETVELASDTASIEFASVPQDGLDLYIEISGRTSENGDYTVRVAFNNDTTNSNYYRMFLSVNNTSATATSNADRLFGGLTVNGYTSPIHNTLTARIFAYTSNYNKGYLTQFQSSDDGSSYRQMQTAGEWANSSAIETIALIPEGNFLANSVASLYTITAD